LSATLQDLSRCSLAVGEFSPVPELLPFPRPLHWLDLARPLHRCFARFFAHPLTMALVWGAFYLLCALMVYGWLLVVML
jgi:hypothetical protein